MVLGARNVQRDTCVVVVGWHFHVPVERIQTVDNPNVLCAQRVVLVKVGMLHPVFREHIHQVGNPYVHHVLLEDFQRLVLLTALFVRQGIRVQVV